MNRRHALKLGLLGPGALWPAAATAQDDFGRSARRPVDDLPRPRRTSTADDSLRIDGEPLGDPDRTPAVDNLDVPPANFGTETGHSWRSFDIARYTSRAASAENPRPQNAIVEWIFRRTGSAIWHGDRIAVLSAGRAQLRAYHNARVLDIVQDYVERFTRATADVLSVRVRFVTAQDPRWRYAVHGRLKRIGTGPQGQQLWTVTPDEANLIRSQMQLYQGFRLLADKTVRMMNGQTMTMETADLIDYVSGLQSEGATGAGQQPRADKLKEGVTLRFSPLLTYDGDALDAAIDLRSTTIRRLIRTKVMAQREVGPTDVTIDVPEASETRLNQIVDQWPLGRTLLIAAGITPGILQEKAGFLNLRVPGMVPTDTELLVFLDVEPVRESVRPAPRRPAPSDRDRPLDEFDLDEPDLDREPPPRVSTRGRFD
ncbi:MAG: hypothetical protein KatS3mg108_3820 [Isosphaeraceae bacterium]|jgi:hypothetical protein|nr:MAG: hypothetical protein KatS3mg108_3820 [Isosphaeraceae bacterium]